MRVLVTMSLASLLSVAIASAQPAPRERALVEDWRLDGNEQDFPAIGFVTVGRDGVLVIPIDADMKLRFYDSTGVLKQTVGRRGDGPGEFRRLAKVGWIHDTLWVNDLISRRFSLFTRDGRFIRSIVMPQASDITAPPAGSSKVISFTAWSLTPDSHVVGAASIELSAGTPAGFTLLSVPPSGGRARLVTTQPRDTARSLRIPNGPGYYGPRSHSPLGHQSISPRTALVPLP